MQPVFLRKLEVSIDRREVLRLAGYPVGAETPASVSEVLDSVLAEAASLVAPAAVYGIHPVGVFDGVISLDGGPEFRSKGLSELLAGSEHACLFIVTVGAALGAATAAAMAEGRLARSVFLDAAGSAAVEAAADAVQNEVGRSTGGRPFTQRYSPGYCDWGLGDQQAVFKNLPANELGVSLNDAFFMEPEKSVSAIFGIGPVGATDFKRDRRPPCRTCGLKTCRHRVVDK